MKQPTLEEVKEYFKNADKCISTQNTKFNIDDYDIENAFIDCNAVCVKANKSGITKEVHIYDYDYKEYAKILTYKEKTFSITESQINDIYHFIEYQENADKFRSWFPDAFEVPEAFESEVKELKIGTWYKYGNALFNHQEKHKSYGLLKDKWINEWGTNAEYFNEYPIEATEQEVFEALKNEAVKRGFVGIHTYVKFNNKEGVLEKRKGNFSLAFPSNILFYQGLTIFNRGKWAEIIPTITLSKAEQKLGEKIIV